MTRQEQKQALIKAERDGGRRGMRCTLNGNKIIVNGGKFWMLAFERGYRLGEVIAYLKPWTPVGRGAKQ